MTSFKLNLISVKVSFHDIFKKTLNITPVNITSFTVLHSVSFKFVGLCSSRQEWVFTNSISFTVVICPRLYKIGLVFIFSIEFTSSSYLSI